MVRGCLYRAAGKLECRLSCEPPEMNSNEDDASEMECSYFQKLSVPICHVNAVVHIFQNSTHWSTHSTPVGSGSSGVMGNALSKAMRRA